MPADILPGRPMVRSSVLTMTFRTGPSRMAVEIPTSSKLYRNCIQSFQTQDLACLCLPTAYSPCSPLGFYCLAVIQCLVPAWVG
eukprot:g61036.t1